MLILITEACLLIVFFLTLVSDYILKHPQIQSRLRLRYLCSLRSPVFFNDSSRKLLLISGACINNGNLSSYWASSSVSRSALLSLPLSLLTPEP